MKKKGIPIFCLLKNKEGGILFPVLAILFMFTCLLLFITQDYFARRELLVNTKDFYLAKTLEELSVNQVDPKVTEPQTVTYNIGMSTWKVTQGKNQYSIETSLSNQYKRTSWR